MEMIDAKKKAELDQQMALMLDFLPTQWRLLFLRLIQEGFTETQALDLLKSYIKASCGSQAG